MNIEFIRLKNFKAFKDITIGNIPAFAVFVGANGVGKSSLFDVFAFLKDCFTYDLKIALSRRGGFSELISRHENKTNSIKQKKIEIEIKYRMEIANKNRLVTYLIEISLENNKPIVSREILRYKRQQYGSPFHFLDFQNGEGFAINNEENFDKPDSELTKEPQTLQAKDTLAIKGLGQFERFKAAAALHTLINNWHISDIHINQARGIKDSLGSNEHLSASGDNLQHVAKNLQDNYPEIFKTILSKMKTRVPGVDAITTSETEDGRLLLKFNDGAFKDPFIDRYVSDGTIKMFAYLVLLHDPKPHSFLCIEEPENQLYPTLLELLAEEFREYAMRGGQVFVSTHSPDFLNASTVDEVFWLSKNKGYTNIYRANEDSQIIAYMNEGDKMGYLWKQGLFSKVDP